MVTVKGKKPENQNPGILLAAAVVAIAAAMLYRVLLSGPHEQPAVQTQLSAPPATAASETRPRSQDPWSGALPNSVPQKTSPSPQTRNQLSALNEILASKSDNDPRLDHLLRNFSPEAKEALKEKYRELPAEDRNGRGTVVFLLGREIQGPDDAAFLADVLGETPCLSLSDCAHEAPRSAQAHHDDLSNVTLNYPQLVAVISMEKLLERSGGHLAPSLKDALIRAARVAESSPVAAISHHGRELESKLESHPGS